MEGLSLPSALPQQSQQDLPDLLLSSPLYSVSVLFGKSSEFYIDQEKMQALRNLSLQKGFLGPCFGLSALCIFTLLFHFPTLPLPSA